MTTRILPIYNGHIGIALRIALLSWVVTLATLTIFVIITIPQQKKTYLQNLESKATSVALSLRDVAAGAAVNEDFASLVTASQNLMAGDPDLDFLVIVQNNGYALIFKNGGKWYQDNLESFWLPEKRVSSGTLETVPVLNTRAFHYASPFDYSGIQWGWIHVGLSLTAYDKTVSDLYQNTLWLAVGCVLFSLIASVLYANQLVKPILRLRQMVQRIAGGDLSVRAEMVRRDELGNLADSVNTMASALLRRDRTLETVRHAAQQFLHGSAWDMSIEPILEKLGRAAEASHVCIFEQHHADNTATLRFEWTAPGMTPFLNDPNFRTMSGSAAGMAAWADLLRHNHPVNTTLSTAAAERPHLERNGIRSLIIIPIFVDGQWWGGLGLADCATERVWTEAEQDSLRAVADMLGATIARQRAQQALLEAKNTLEERVRERTHELQSQVAAKEEALTELAAAQSSLMEMSRSAGMAEVATGVLHNVGNVLNSVNVSCNLLLEQLRESRMANVGKLADLLNAPEAAAPEYLTTDPRGRQIPVYMTSLAEALTKEQQVLMHEARSLHLRIEHIKEIVAMQQTYGRVLGVMETLPPAELMEDALKLNAEGLIRHEIRVDRRYRQVPPVTVDKHKVLQILLNLINNAKYACTHSTDEKIITLRIERPQEGWIRLEVEDNGMGISQENLTRIFQHGFTTRREGHGFGLHSGALAARDLGGRLSVHSDGPGLGATFTLDFPTQPGDTQ